MDIENLEESLRRIEIDCGLPEGFCFGLLHEQSWSFVIKLHAILEAAVSQLLVNVFDRKELSKVFAELQMSNFKTGKLAFVRSLRACHALCAGMAL